MKSAFVFLGFLFAEIAGAQTSIVTSFSSAGNLTWTNVPNTNALYRVEWASQVGGPWHSFAYQPINTVDASSNTSFTVSVPMFYRVVMQTNPPPTGMAWIDGGDVELGQVDVAEPVHTNFISGFYMDRTEVTQDLWYRVREWAITNGYSFYLPAYDIVNGPTHPQSLVPWFDCAVWCNARSQMENLTPCYYRDTNFTVVETSYSFAIGLSNVLVNWHANGYRLPTEAEWEKAARGGRRGHLFPWGGDTISHSQANYFANSNFAYDVSPSQGYHPWFATQDVYKTSPVATFDANGYGLYDMAGNAVEWCWDQSGGSYSTNYAIDPPGPTNSPIGRIARGGGYAYEAERAQCAARVFFTTFAPMNLFGFRCVRRQ